ncbi:hypothetical protein BDV06DRAFT_233350 [Aspergillus oleicola]
MWSKATCEQEPRRGVDIACYSCRRDRQRPQCLVCLETSQDCCYPERPLKPGPKLGSLKPPRKRSVQHSEIDGTERFPKSNTPRKKPETTSKGAGSPLALDATLEGAEGCAEACTGGNNVINSTETASDPRSNIHDLSFILHPAHEAASPENKEPASQEIKCSELHCTKFEQACIALSTTATSMATIVRIYFDNMVAISLFHQPRFAQQLHDGVSPTHIGALLAAIAAYAARLCPDEVKEQCTSWPNEHDSPAEYFLALTFSLVDTALTECGDEPPSLRTIQALTLATHLQLTQGVRGKAWRSLGMCIRLAYELHLHLVDASPEGLGKLEVHQWCWKEEQRRVWWAIWEMDVFASTIRRTPPAIDWSQIETLLPVADEHWFNDQLHASCFMERDPIRRWKTLQESGNQSPKAWFLVVNSFMKQAQVISSPRSIPPRGPSHQADASKDLDTKAAAESEVLQDMATQKLGTLANCLQCFTSVLPERLRYRNQYLNFEARAAGRLSSTRQHHCSIYNIYVMVQLAKLMIHRYEIFQYLGSLVRPNHEPTNAESQKLNSNHHRRASGADNLALAQYFEAADNILSIVTRSCDDHVRFINPFLSSTIWLAAAVQIFRQEFDQGETERAFIRSKFEVLYMTYTQCVSWWKTHTAMEQNLEYLATQLERYRGAKDLGKSHLGRLSETSRTAQSEQAQRQGKCSTQGETSNMPENIRKLTEFVECKEPSSGVIPGRETSNVHNTISVDALAPHHSPISMVNSGPGCNYNGSELSGSDATPPGLTFTQGSSLMNDLFALDALQPRYSDATDCRERDYSHNAGDLSAEVLDSLLSTRPSPETSFARFLAGDPDFGNELSLDLPTNIHGILSGQSMY